MAGIETLSLACNIMQIIAFACETLSLCKAIYQGQSFDAHLMENAESIKTLSSDLQTHSQTISPQTADEKRLHDIAGKCVMTSRALEEEARFISDHQSKGSLAATLRVAVKTNWRKGRLERLDKTLQSYKSTMESHLIARIW